MINRSRSLRKNGEGADPDATFCELELVGLPFDVDDIDAEAILDLLNFYLC